MLQEVTEQIEKLARSVCSEIHTAMPGKIISFDLKKITAVVQPTGRYVTSSGNSLDYPKISDCPVIFPFSRTSGIGITFPVLAGDDCLIIFSESELDEWRTGAQSQASLKYDLSSAIVIPGLSRNDTCITDTISDSSLMLKANDNIVRMTPSDVEIKAGSNRIYITTSGIEISGNITVKGSITSDGDIKAGSASLMNHTHVSSTAGSNTGKPV